MALDIDLPGTPRVRSGSRVLMLGGGDLVAVRLGQALALRDLGFREGIGGSGGGVALALALGGIDINSAESVCRQFRFHDLLDVPTSRSRIPHLRLAAGQAFRAQMNELMTALGSNTWASMRTSLEERRAGTKRIHRLGLRVSVLTLHNTTLETTAHEMDNGAIWGRVAREILHGAHTLGYTLPDDLQRMPPGIISELYENPVADTVVDSARHPLVIRPRCFRDPNRRDIHLVFDGALLWSRPGIYRSLPDAPTVLSDLALHASDPAVRSATDVKLFPGFYVLRSSASRVRFAAPGPHLLSALNGMRFAATGDQQVEMLHSAYEETTRCFDFEAWDTYVERWNGLRQRADRAERSSTPDIAGPTRERSGLVEGGLGLELSPTTPAGL